MKSNFTENNKNSDEVLPQSEKNPEDDSGSILNSDESLPEKDITASSSDSVEREEIISPEIELIPDTQDNFIDNRDDKINKFQEYFSTSEEEEIPKITDILLTYLELKKVDEELSDIDDEKGDLPQTIKNINSKLNIAQSESDDKKSLLDTIKNEMDNMKKEIDMYEEKINKYDEQKYSVKSNKEYDEIVKTIETMFEEVSKNESKLKEAGKQSETLVSEIESLDLKINELKSDLDEKQQLLNELDEEYKIEESSLKRRRDELCKKLDENNLTLYERINRMHKGEATAIVRNGNCSGCYNSIPPQKVIEIRTAEKIFTCQSCGRILVSEELLNS